MAGQNGVGPPLQGVLGRKAGSLAGFTFKAALQASGLTWDDKTLNDFLVNPAQKVPGTAMAVMLPQAADRADLIAYLETLKADPASAAAAAAPTVPLGSVQGVHRCPGLLGGMEWNGPAYSPRSNTLFVAAVDWCGTFTQFDQKPDFVSESHDYGGAVVSDPRAQAKGCDRARCFHRCGALEASVEHASCGGAGGEPRLFTGDMNNDFRALDAANGKVLYRFNTGGSIGGGVVSYELQGKQYAAVMSGVVSGFFGSTGLPTVIVFGLP